MIASVHGPVRPVCAQGSSVVASVAADSVGTRGLQRNDLGMCATGWLRRPGVGIARRAYRIAQPTHGLGAVAVRTVHAARIAVAISASSDDVIASS